MNCEGPSDNELRNEFCKIANHFYKQDPGPGPDRQFAMVNISASDSNHHDQSSTELRLGKVRCILKISEPIRNVSAPEVLVRILAPVSRHTSQFPQFPRLSVCQTNIRTPPPLTRSGWFSQSSPGEIIHEKFLQLSSKSSTVYSTTGCNFI